MKRRLIVFTLFCLLIPAITPAQQAVDPMNRYHRLICLVHLTGTGRDKDPIMPEYIATGVAASTAAAATNATADPGTMTANAEQQLPSGGTTPSTGKGDPTQPQTPSTAAARPGIISWSMQLTDDKNMAIIHVVAVDRGAFEAILADKRSDVRVFEIGKDSKEAIEKEMRKFKKDFSLETFQVVAR